jgi:predicted flavoprotein YhiN
VLTATGVEGSLIYAASAPLRETIERDGQATFTVDLLPARTPSRCCAETAPARHALAGHAPEERLKLDGVKPRCCTKGWTAA